MGLFNAVANIGKAVVDTALLVTVDPLVSFKEAMDEKPGANSCTRRARKITRDLEDAHEETFRE